MRTRIPRQTPSDDAESATLWVVFPVLMALGSLSLAMMVVGCGLLFSIGAWWPLVTPQRQAAPAVVLVAVTATPAATATARPTATATATPVPQLAAPTLPPVIMPPTLTATQLPPTATWTPLPTATASPLPTATPWPTATTLPTWTPIPTAGLSPEVEVYLEQMQSAFGPTVPAMKAIGVALEAPELDSNAWKLNLGLQMALIQDSYRRLAGLTAPSQLAVMHATLLNAMQQCDQATRRLAYGIDHRDVAAVNEVVVLIQQCDAGIVAATQQLAAVVVP